MGRDILQSLKETKPDKISGFLVSFYEKLFQNLKDAACLIEFSLFMYVLDNEMNKLSHIDVRASGISAARCDVLLPTASEVWEGFSKRGNDRARGGFSASEQERHGFILVDGLQAHSCKNPFGQVT